ncbi:ABC transporter ATP-binding protein [Natrinema ejinorense]|uniref:Peptide ABC transporter ATP-binding protein n=1 Tax=Natrinema ejinorense TaxID=373386 RepID=A0A2A5R131_9EURY|nr:oligopeptide/dipeptide ABC transporter ATP-binding protein [Natrinema ejinorense]PCR92776.1 peptide ABC transporter ATP-binding protein [Natrinema ejinorense]
MSSGIRLDEESVYEDDEALLELDGVRKYFNQDSGFLAGLQFDSNEFPPFSVERETVKAVDDISLEIQPGETLGLVGESGCGKSTLGRTILRLLEPTEGDIYFKGENLADLSGETLRKTRSDMQMIFQDPQSSLNPRMKVGQIIEEPMRAHDMPATNPDVTTTATVDAEGVSAPIEATVADDADIVVDADDDGVVRVPVSVYRDDNGVEAIAPAQLTATATETDDGTVTVDVAVSASKDELRRERAKTLLEKVGLDPQHYNRHPHAFSGGQRQRINLARALSVDPDFVVCDEPVSALDVSIQAQVLNTMEKLQEEFGLTYLFIAHDLSVIRHISDRVAVMYLGHIVELAEKEELFENPQHPYTRALLESIPVPDPRENGPRGVLEGEVPSPVDPPSGCRFRTRCPRLIAPDAYDWSEGKWAQTRAFMRAVKRRTFEPMPAARIEAEFFDDTLPRGEPGSIVEEAIDLVAADREAGEDRDDKTQRWEAATELLLEAFAERSICARERPAYELESEYGSGKHAAACHLHR